MEKQIKVQYSSRSTGYPYYGRVASTPKIQMEGKWLDALGFHIGAQLSVSSSAGQILIRLAESSEIAASKQNKASLAN